MNKECADALKREFGYIPDEERGERWVVFQDRTLVVVHPDNRPRLYSIGCAGSYYELEPLP